MARNVLIVGPGAIGLLLASRMHKAGMEVTLLDHSEARAKDPKSICYIHNGIEEHLPVLRTADPSVAKFHKHIIVCVKAHSTPVAAKALTPYVVKDTAVLSIQNGLGNLEALQTLSCHDHVRLATITYGARRLNAHTVLLTGNGSILIGAATDDRVGANWCTLLKTAGFETEYCPDTKHMLWVKLVLNAALNPVTALYNIKNGELLSHPEAWQRSMDLLSESVKIANAHGVPMQLEEMKSLLTQVCKDTSENQTSMLEDLNAGKITEIAHINGAIVKTAYDLQMAADVNQRIQQEIEKQQT